MRRRSRKVTIGTVTIGGENPVAIQSMTSTRTADPAATGVQIRRLAAAGCELVRVAVPNETAARVLPELVRSSPVPLIADVHFDYRLACLSLQAGAAKVRINPGNIGGRDKFLRVVDQAAVSGAALRIGVNAGSLEKSLRHRFGGAVPEALVESALGYLRWLEGTGFSAVVLSLKAAAVPTTIAAYRCIARETDFPLHLGVTEAGPGEIGTIKSAVGLGVLLAEGIGDTVRVSLTADPLAEVRVARRILQALELRRFGPDLISCPTCGRCQIDLIPLVEKVATLLEGSSLPLTVAVMGCAVNGPGEAREADLGLAGGKKKTYLFRRGKIIRAVEPGEALTVLQEELDRWAEGESKMIG